MNFLYAGIVDAFWREILACRTRFERYNMKIAVFVRASNKKEREDKEERVVWAKDNEVRVLNPETRTEKGFKFDYTVS